MCPQYKNPSPKNNVKQLLYRQRVSVRQQAPTPEIHTDPNPIKPERSVVEPTPTTLPQNKINKLHIVTTCVNYSDFLIVSLSENVKIIDPKFITVVTDSNDLLTQKVCKVFGVNCVVTDRFYEDGAVFNKGKGLNEGIKSIVNPEWILITDADIVFPPDFLDILSKKTINHNKLYAASRYLCTKYSTFQKYQNKQIKLNEIGGTHRCPPVGYFQLFSINHPNIKNINQPIYPEVSKDASWSDMLFADKFPQKECIQSINLIHLGDDSLNWKGRKTNRFITDNVFTYLINKQQSFPFVPSLRQTSKSGKLAVITSFFNPANYENIKQNYLRFKDFMTQSGVELFTAELVFNDNPFFTEESKNNLHIRGNQNNIMWQKERLLNLVLDIVPPEYNNIAWIDCDVIFDNPNWVNETNEQLQSFKMLQLYQSGFFYNLKGKIDRISDGIVYHLHKIKQNTNVDFHPLYGGTPGLAWAIRRECINTIKFVDNQIIGGGDAIMFLAGIGKLSDQFIYNKMNSKMLSQTLVWSNKFYNEIKNSLFYVTGKAYHLYHGSNIKRNYNHRMDYLNENDYNPNQDIKLDQNSIWIWNSDKPKLHKKLFNYFLERDEDDNLQKLNYHFDGIFCINLDRRQDKWNKMVTRFNKFNIHAERVRAYDGSWDIVKNEWKIIQHQLKQKFGTKMDNPSAYGLLENEFAYGTLCSHNSIIQKAKQLKLKRILVMEDDVLFHKNFNNEIKQILKYTNWKLLYLGASQHDWTNITIKSDYYTPNKTLGGFAYALDESMYDIILNLALKHEKSFDNCLGNYDGLDIQSLYPNESYVLYPNLIIADVSQSDLRGNRNQTEHSIKMKWDLNLYDFD